MKLNNKGFAITGILYGLLILFALFQKQFIEGIALQGIKG